jgi:DNA-binding GntR family transcriptional regulator
MEPRFSESLVDLVYSSLLEDILSGRLVAGAKLSEPRIAASAQVSRAPVREAIRRLEERRLVTHRPRQGVRVIEPDEAMRIHLMSVRGVLEGLAAREAALRATDEDIRSLQEMLDGHGQALRNHGPVEYWQSSANTDFHHRVGLMSGNDYLIDLINDRFWPVFQLMRRARRVEPGRIERSYIEHCRIANCIAERDGDLAELLMRRHIEAALNR